MKLASPGRPALRPTYDPLTREPLALTRERPDECTIAWITAEAASFHGVAEVWGADFGTTNVTVQPIVDPYLTATYSIPNTVAS